MKYLILLVSALITPFSLDAQISEIELQQPWNNAYAGNDATDKHVIGLWSFDGKNPGADFSGNGHAGIITGAKINPKGKFGAGLESFAGFPITDKYHGMKVKNSPKLTPAGAFTIEMWIKPHEMEERYKRVVLIDKKYVPSGHRDYIFSMYGNSKDKLRVLTMQMGFGQRSVDWHSDRFEFAVGKWTHIAFTYDGAGTGEFFINGQIRGSRKEDGVGSIMPGNRGLSIGDRMGSNYAGFPGVIDQVRISNGVMEFRPVRIERVSDRQTFIRMERNIALKFRVTNLKRQPLSKARLTFSIDTESPKPVEIAELAPGTSRDISFALDTKMRPDDYQVSASFTTLDKIPFTVAETFHVKIAPRKLPNEFPVLMWGGGLTELERLNKIGFTHALGLRANYGEIFKAGRPGPANIPEKLQQNRQQLDAALAAGITIASQSAPGTYLRSDPKYQRVGRDGKPYLGREDICASLPEMKKFVHNVGVSMAQSYGDLPAYGAALLHTEVRGHSKPCFHQHDLDAFKKTSGGLDIPKEVVNQRGVDYKKIKDFPKDRVIADNDPIYSYYKWQWKKGDGWNDLNTELHKGLKTAKRDDFWTWYDPAVRVGTVFGSGGGVDVISQWTYSYPDPIRIGLATDELLAMSAGAETKPDVMKMTQIIWYRSQTAPEPKPGKPHPIFQATWEKEQPDAPFITIPPMQLREAFWTKIARPIKGIMYHGWSSLVPTANPRGYRYTHPETQHELERLIETVVEPLGPTLKNIPGIKSDIAFYESFAAQVYARRGTYGWNGGWAGDSYHIAMWTGLQPEVVYDETITSKGLDGYKMLFMIDCDVVTKSVLEKIKAFQKKGGIIIGDKNLTPAIKADILIETYRRTGLAHQDKAELQSRSAKLRTALADRYTRYLDSSNPEVIPYRRRFADTDYVFLTNDHREYGRYVGHHGRVMENGLPANAVITLKRKSGFAYDLVRHQPVEMRRKNDHLLTDVKLGPGEGRMIMVTSAAIDRISLVAPKTAKRGDQKNIVIEIVDAGGKAIKAVIPIEIRIEDAEGRVAEQSGNWAALHGKATFTIDIAPNDIEGVWQISVRELASGKTAAANFRVGEIPSDKPDTKLMDKNAGNAVQPKG